MLCNNGPQNWVALDHKPFCSRWRSVCGVSGEPFPLTSAELPGSSTQPSVASGPEAPLLTLFVGPAEMQGPSTVTKAPCRALLVLRSRTPHGPKQTQCEGWGKTPRPLQRSPLQIPTAGGASEGGRIKTTSVFQISYTIMSLLKSFLLIRIKIMGLRSLKHVL